MRDIPERNRISLLISPLCYLVLSSVVPHSPLYALILSSARSFSHLFSKFLLCSLPLSSDLIHSPLSYPSFSSQAGNLCNNAHLRDGVLIGSPTEGALLVAAAKFGLRDQREAWLRSHEIPFSYVCAAYSSRCFVSVSAGISSFACHLVYTILHYNLIAILKPFLHDRLPSGLYRFA